MWSSSGSQSKSWTSIIRQFHTIPGIYYTFNRCGKSRSFYFSSNVPPIIALDLNQVHTCPEDLLCTVEEVTELLKSIDTTKSTGPDGKMLKMTVDAIAPSVTALFNLSIHCNRPPKEWKISNVVPIPKQNQIIKLLLTLGRFHCSQSWVNYLRSISTSWYLIISLTTVRYQMDSGVFKEGSQLLRHFL